MNRIITTVEELEDLENFVVVKTLRTTPTFYEVFNDGKEYPTEFFLFGDAEYIGSGDIILPVEVVYTPPPAPTLLPLPDASENATFFTNNDLYESAATQLLRGEYKADKDSPMSLALIALIEQDDTGWDGNSLTIAAEHLKAGTDIPEGNACSLAHFVQVAIDLRVQSRKDGISKP